MTETSRAQDDALCEFVDDPKIYDQDILWRRINEDWLIIDENTGRVRLKSMAFQDPIDGSPMSVLLADVHRDLGAIIECYPRHGLVSITVELARELGQRVSRDPTDEDLAHAHVSGKKTLGDRRKLAKEAKWVIPLPIKFTPSHK